MAVNNIIVYFPWGAGGNLIKNLCSIDYSFDFFDEHDFRLPDQSPQERFEFLIDYYYRPISDDEWLKREWAIRKKYSAKYHNNGTIQYWDPAYRTMYECHGLEEELAGILAPTPLRCFDRTRIDAGEIADTPSPWLLADCQHVFLLPDNIQLITDIYHSKNSRLEQLHPNTPDASKKKHLFLLNRLMTLRLENFSKTLEDRGCEVYKYCADTLFTDAGAQLINHIFQDTAVTVPEEYVTKIHSKWLQDTRDIYQQFHNRDLP